MQFEPVQGRLRVEGRSQQKCIVKKGIRNQKGVASHGYVVALPRSMDKLKSMNKCKSPRWGTYGTRRKRVNLASIIIDFSLKEDFPG